MLYLHQGNQGKGNNMIVSKKAERVYIASYRKAAEFVVDDVTADYSGVALSSLALSKGDFVTVTLLHDLKKLYNHDYESYLAMRKSMSVFHERLMCNTLLVLCNTIFNTIDDFRNQLNEEA